MNSKQYQKMRDEQFKEAMKNAGITEYTRVCLSADQQEYEVTLKDGTTVVVPSKLPLHED